MGVTTDKTNKPFNPRGNDQSPKGYNRAALYSGKALDFDGVNDLITTPNISVQSSNVWTYSFNLKKDPSNTQYVFDARTTGGDGYTSFFNTANELIFYDSESGGGSRKFNLSFENDIWYFFTIVSNGDDVKLYINGIYVDFVDGFNSIASSNDLYIGSRYSSSDMLNGQIAGFKIFNTALTAAQVADLYNNPEKVVPTGVDNTSLKLWLPMMEGAGTKCLDGASLNTATERVENGDFSDGTTDWVGNPETTLSVTNGQLDIQSAGGSGQYGAAFSEVNFTSGKYYLIQLDVISCNNPAQIRIGSRSEPTNYSNNIWNSGEIGIGSHSTIWYATTNDDYLSIGGRNDVTTLVIDNVSVKEINVGDISGATWTHGIGAPVAQTSVIDWNKTILDKTNEFLIPQGLTSGRDLLGNLFENVRKQGALNLDGKSWAEVHDNESLDFGTGDLTIECWSKATYENTGSGVNVLMSLGGDLTSGNTSAIVTTSTSFSFYLGGSSTLISGYTTGQWYHIVGVRNGSSIYIYINGSLENSKAQSGTITNTHAKQIGRDSTTDRNYKDQIAQPRIYNRALTAAEIQQNYDAGKNTYTN